MQERKMRKKAPIPKHTATLSEIVEFYLASSDFAGLNYNTKQSYNIQLDKALATVVEGKPLGKRRIHTLKVRHMTQAYDLWLESGIRTANLRKASLSVAWKHAMRYDVMEHNPIALVKGKADNRRTVKWEREQVRAFFNVAYSDIRYRSIGLIFHMAYAWAQRIGDMRLLKWDAIDLDACRLDLTQSKRNAEVHLPIDDNLCEMLRIQHQDFGFQDYVAPRTKHRHGQYTPYEMREISPLVNEVIAEAGLPSHLTAMDLRRTGVAEMMEAGVDLLNVIQVTGHKNIASLKNYQVNTFSGASKALAARGNKDEL
jgi:integrase